MSSFSPDTMLVLTLSIPLTAALGITLLGRYPNIREGVTLAASVLLLYLVASLYDATQSGVGVGVELPELLPGLRVAFSIEPLGMLFSLVGSFLWVVTSVYSIGYMRAHDEQHQTRFYTCFAIAIAAVMGVAFADNLFTLFIFYEVLTLSTYPLVTHAGTDKARQGGRVYLGLLLSTSILFFLLAIIGTWSITGTLDFRQGGIFDPGISSLTAGALLVLFVFGIGKAALMVSTLLNIAYLLPIPIRGFFPGNDRQQATGIKEAPLPVLIALSVTAAGCLVLFFYPQPLYEIALAIAQSPGGG